MIGLASSNLQYTLSEQQMDTFFTALTTLLAGYLIAILFVILTIGAMMIAANWCIFKKAGTSGWKALVPFYCDYTFYKIAWKRKYFFIMLVLFVIGFNLSNPTIFKNIPVLLSFAGDILMFAAAIIDIISIVKLAKAFRKGGGFAVGLILLPFVFYPILGFGSAKYRRRKRRKREIIPPPVEGFE